MSELSDLRAADLDELLSRKAFHRFLWDVLADAGWMHQTFSGEALQSAFKEGRRAMANQIIARCMARRDDALILVLQEGATTLAPLIKGQQVPDERDNPLYRSSDAGSTSGDV